MGRSSRTKKEHGFASIVSERINREKYADRYERVIKLIEARYSSEEKTDDDKEFVELEKGFDSKLGCEGVVLAGCFAGIYVCISSLIMSFLLEDSSYRFDHLVSALVFGILAGFTYFKSRIGSTLMFGIFVASNLITWVFELKLTGILAGIVLSMIFFSAMIGTFVWHQKYASKLVKGKNET